MAFVREFKIEPEGYDRECQLGMMHPTDQCFYCGEQLITDLVYWAGFSGQIWMHADCAKELGCRLIVDWKSKHSMREPDVPPEQYASGGT